MDVDWLHAAYSRYVLQPDQAFASLVPQGAKLIKGRRHYGSRSPSLEVLFDEVSFPTSLAIGAEVPWIDPETAQACIQSGARFIVSPALNEERSEESQLETPSEREKCQSIFFCADLS